MSGHSDEGDDVIDEAAAHWLVRLREANLQSQASVRAELTRWCEIDPRHAESFARMQAVWEVVDDLADRPDFAPARRDAIQELGRLRRRVRFRVATVSGLRLGFGLAAAAAIAAYLIFWPTVQTFNTGIGERRTIMLADGSRVEMDADSALSVELGRSERAIHMLKGEVYFTVAMDAARPFVVACGNRTVTATGTAFDVETLPNGMHVTLVEGHVAVRTAAGGPVVARLDPGDSMTVESGEVVRVVHQANMLALLAWKTGRLMFDDVPMSEAVRRMRRYTRTPVSVDSSVAALRISGVFKTGDLLAMIGAVEGYYPVAAERRDGTIRLTRRP